MAENTETKTRKVRLTIEVNDKGELNGESLAVALAAKLKEMDKFHLIEKIKVDETVVVDQESLREDYPDLFANVRSIAATG